MLNGLLNTNDFEGRYYQLSWWAEQSIENNSSIIHWQLDAKGQDDLWYREYRVNLQINGVDVYTSNYSTDRWVGVVATGDITISHNPDGTKTFPINLSAAVFYNYDNVSASGNFTLDPLGRASSLIVTDGILGVVQEISAVKSSTAFTHTLTWSCGVSNGIIANKSADSKWSFTPPISLASEVTKESNVNILFKLTTYNGNNIVGSVTSTASMILPSDASPDFSILITDLTHLNEDYGHYIQNKSNLNIQINASAKYGASIESYNVTYLGNVYNSNNFNVSPSISGNNEIIAIVTDSRGLSTTKRINVYTEAYSDPFIKTSAVHRCNQDGSENLNGGWIKLDTDILVTYFSGKNDIEATIIFNFDSGNPVSYTDKITSNEFIKSYIVQVPVESACKITMKVEDLSLRSITTKTVNASMGGALFHFSADGYSIAVGKNLDSSKQGLDIGFEHTYMDKLHVNEIIYPDAGMLSTVVTKTGTNSSSGNGTWREYTVNFGVTFKDIPFVNVVSTSPIVTETIYIKMISKTGMVYGVYQPDNSLTYATRWFAIGSV